jgi:hypothetical protein
LITVVALSYGIRPGLLADLATAPHAMAAISSILIGVLAAHATPVSQSQAPALPIV